VSSSIPERQTFSLQSRRNETTLERALVMDPLSRLQTRIE
jgi:hypothetical protein